MRRKLRMFRNQNDIFDLSLDWSNLSHIWNVRTTSCFGHMYRVLAQKLQTDWVTSGTRPPWLAELIFRLIHTQPNSEYMLSVVVPFRNWFRSLLPPLHTYRSIDFARIIRLKRNIFKNNLKKYDNSSAFTCISTPTPPQSIIS